MHVIWLVCCAPMVTDFWGNVMLSGAFLTVRLTLFFLPLYARAVIFTLPGEMALIAPSSMRTMELSEDFRVYEPAAPEL